MRRGVHVSATRASEVPRRRNHNEQTSRLSRMVVAFPQLKRQELSGTWKGIFRLVAGHVEAG